MPTWQVGTYDFPIAGGGQTRPVSVDFGPSHAQVETFVARMRDLSDEERLAVAEERRAVDETFHARALRAAAEALVGRGEPYALARREVGQANLPERLADEREDAARWTEVARLVQLAIDEALVALVASDVLHPNYLRELHRPWRALSSRGQAPPS